MKQFKVGDKALLNAGTRVKFCDGEGFITKNLKRNDEVEIVKVEKAHKSVGGCCYYIRATIKGKELISSHSVPNNKFLPEELRQMLIETKASLEKARRLEATSI